MASGKGLGSRASWPPRKTHSNPCFPTPAFRVNRSRLAFSIRRATMAVGNPDSRRARWEKRVAGVCAPGPMEPGSEGEAEVEGEDGCGVYWMSSRQELSLVSCILKPPQHTLSLVTKSLTHTYCAKLRLTLIMVAFGSLGSMKMISLTYAIGGS